MQSLACFTAISCLFLVSRVHAELITRLPAQPANVSFKQYSGYIVTDANHGRALFYYFVEADAADPLLHPLTLWLNGGPGCSSLGFGAFMEHGPFQPGEDGNLVKNQYSWNLESNILYVESPIGVGFSYSNTSSDYIGVDDTFTAEENLKFLVNWFKEFPQYRKSDLFLTGESYAGHYVPQLAALVLDYNKRSNGRPIKLKALAMGNPLLDWEISIDNTEFLWSHGIISDELLMLRKTVCSRPRYAHEMIRQNISRECSDMIHKEAEEISEFTDSGDLILPLCTSTSSLGQSLSLRKINTHHAELPMKSVTPGDPCIGDRIHRYLNKPRVQEALHANTTRLPDAWEFCGGPDYQRDNLGINIIPILLKLLRSNVPILLFNGDQDSKIPLTQTRIIANMLAKEMKFVALGNYAPWFDTMQNQIGGRTQSFGRARNGKNVTLLTFATVRGAAHEVPYTSPSQGLTLFRAFIKGSPLPTTIKIPS